MRHVASWGIALMVCSVSARAQSAPANGLAEWQPLGANGAQIMRLVGGASPTELVAFRVHYPADFKVDSGVHYHFGTEHITVLKGTIVVGFGDHADYSTAKSYGPGSFIVIPAGTPHYEMFRGDFEAHVESIGPMTTVWITHANGQSPEKPEQPHHGGR
jgi:quercetin dioxygenase-like cupin family protein